MVESGPMQQVINDAQVDAVMQSVRVDPHLANMVIDDGITLLILTAWAGRVDAVGLLLDHGAHIDHQDERGETALIYACLQGHRDVLALLLSRGADMSHLGHTFLMRIARTQHPEAIFDVLLKHGGYNVDAVDAHGFTALTFACYGQHGAVVASLLEAGADPSWWQRYKYPLLQVIELRGAHNVDVGHVQAWFRKYTIIKARTLRDAVMRIAHLSSPVQQMTTRSRTLFRRVAAAPVCLTFRVLVGFALPVVELRTEQEEDGGALKRKRRSARLLRGSGGDDGGVAGDICKRALGRMVIAYTLEQVSTELFAEMMARVPVTADAAVTSAE